MKYCFFFFVIAVFISGCQQTVEPESHALPDSLEWMETYYYTRDESQITVKIQQMAESGILEDKMYTSFMSAFFAQIFAANPDHLQEWFVEIQELSPAQQAIFLIALRWANTDVTHEMLEYRRKTLDDNISVMIRNLLNLPVPDFTRVPVRSADELDCCWGSFFASAAEPFFLAVIQTAVADEQGATLNKTAFEARISLRNWIEKDPVIARLTDDFAAEATPRQQQILRTLRSQKLMVPDVRFR